MSSRAKVFVCVSCRPRQGEGEADNNTPGSLFLEGVRTHLDDSLGIEVLPADCLAACERACTIAFAGSGKWTYVVGDIDYAKHRDEVVAAAVAYANSSSGIIPMIDRPPTFRRGVIARIPPAGSSDWSSPNEQT